MDLDILRSNMPEWEDERTKSPSFSSKLSTDTFFWEGDVTFENKLKRKGM